MDKRKRSIKVVSKNHLIDPDALLIILWDLSDERFEYLKNEGSVIKNKDVRFIKELITNKINREEITQKKDASRKKPKKIYREYNFSSIGRALDEIHYLNREDVIKIHDALVADFAKLEDPISPPGIKDNNLLDSALLHAKTSYGDRLKYPTAESSGAALVYALTNNHAFHNGNKRLSIVSLLVFLDKHNIQLTCNEDELFRISLKLADHKIVPEEYLNSDAEIYEAARWISNNSRHTEKGERVISLKRFKQIIQSFGCTILDSGKVERRFRKKFFFLNLPPERLVSKQAIEGSIAEGSIIDKGLIKAFRDDLKLTPEYGIDSEAFYANAGFISSDFILKYKNLLRRLSKV